MRIQTLLLQSGLTEEGLSQEDLSSKSKFEAELEWLLVSKAAVQTYGLLLNDLLNQMLPLSDDIWYWDDVLGSHWNSALYTVQSSPLRVWVWSQDIYSESVQRLQRLQKHHLDIARPFSTSDGAQAPTHQLGDDLGEHQQGEEAGKQEGGLGRTLERALPTTESLSAQWRQFYSIVRESIAERTIADFRRRVVSHVGVGRAEARRKRSELKKLREVIATALGILMVEGLSFGPVEGDAESNSYDGWKGLLERSVSLMDVILLRSPGYVDFPELYEDKIFDVVSNDPELFANDGDIVEAERTRVLARRILDIRKWEPQDRSGKRC
jgi:nuclear-control-of-ATPase protein 2